MSLKEPAEDSFAQASPPEVSRKRPISERRIQANRRNALNSSGPKTERGKRTVARNAIKHGLLAREVVITAGDGKESMKDFDNLVKQLCECLEPVGIVEESLVQTIATCWWRKARVIRAENGEIRKRLDMLAIDRNMRDSDKANLDIASLDTEMTSYDVESQLARNFLKRDRLSAAQVEQTDLRRHRPGLEYLTGLLQKAKSEIVRAGYMSNGIRKKIYNSFSVCDYSFAVSCRDLAPLGGKKEEGRSEEIVDGKMEERRAAVLALIDDRLARFSTFEGYATERENLALDAESRSFSLPPANATDNLRRYEAHLDRQLYRAMDQLERLQRRR
jgi:hypothetical protein